MSKFDRNALWLHFYLVFIDFIGFSKDLAVLTPFMGHHEKLWLENFHASTILFYRQYVDDTFCLFNSDRDATIFFDYINSRHPNIKFTMERQVNYISNYPFLMS